jgi:hypothetical protein
MFPIDANNIAQELDKLLQTRAKLRRVINNQFRMLLHSATMTGSKDAYLLDNSLDHGNPIPLIVRHILRLLPPHLPPRLLPDLQVDTACKGSAHFMSPDGWHLVQ